ncbi:hypothetical protein C8J56DRAFT_958485 [Mycena floridula]|nr:hypothetical protein C8J56DRAFT_958485 [Mycena floridula]
MNFPVIFLCFLCLIPPALSAITQTTAVEANLGTSYGSVQTGTAVNHLCYYPAAPVTPVLECKGTNGAQLAGVMEAHLAQGQSIGYYSPDAIFLGNATYNIPDQAGALALCISGKLLGNPESESYQSLCSYPTTDNQVIPPSANSLDFCVVGLHQNHVDDGCYTVGAASPSSPGRSTEATGHTEDSSRTSTSAHTEDTSMISLTASPSQIATSSAVSSGKKLSMADIIGIVVSIVVALMASPAPWWRRYKPVPPSPGTPPVRPSSPAQAALVLAPSSPAQAALPVPPSSPSQASARPNTP